ncbi:hypothetical protein PIB30_007912 [Stylosanthes scabra]|uniref:Uncharacterized protein n=1 Tax=Stylosanthes scabra TaxID=79078 RepID=A0ABU6S5A9_9FABA|nr:hypothetical protein [Stylosanthes scabra]
MNNKTFSFMNHSRNFDKVRKNHLIEVGIEWYDFACFGIVGATIISSLWILWMNEASAGGKEASNNKSGDFEALNLDENDDENLLVMAAAAATPRRKQNSNINMNNELGISQLWTSCWEGVHPLWLLFTRFSSLVTMAALVSLDVLDYDASIFFYYTEWTFTLVMIYFSMGIIASAYGSWQSIKKPPIVQEEMSEFIKRKSQERVSSNTTLAYYNEEKETNGSVVDVKSPYLKDELKQGMVFWVYLVQITYQVG